MKNEMVMILTMWGLVVSSVAMASIKTLFFENIRVSEGGTFAFVKNTKARAALLGGHSPHAKEEALGLI